MTLLGVKDCLFSSRNKSPAKGRSFGLLSMTACVYDVDRRSMPDLGLRDISPAYRPTAKK